MNDKIAQIIDVGKWVMDKGLTWGTSGNISARENDTIYITGSGTVLGNLSSDDIVVCTMEGEVISGSRKPSKELAMHLAVYRSRKDVGAILHASPFYSTMYACSDVDLKTNLFIEAMYYTESVATIPYHHAGSLGLAAAVKGVCEKARVIFMENHGVLVYDTSLAECQNMLEITENVCKMNILANVGHISLKEVSPHQVSDFLANNYYKKRSSHK
ncbi:MAG: class II aldolase/adducin family protein [Christensenellaceae bacterium]|nr:class II aldolase/adducin family protein [Christensenellaceae bacterium]